MGDLCGRGEWLPRPYPRRGNSSPIGKRRFVGGVDLRHLVDGEGKAVGDGGDVIDFVQRKIPPLARFQVFVEHLISADVEVPHGLRHGLEKLRLVDPNRLLVWRVADSLNRVIASTMILGETLARELAQEMRLHELPAEL